MKDTTRCEEGENRDWTISVNIANDLDKTGPSMEDLRLIIERGRRGGGASGGLDVVGSDTGWWPEGKMGAGRMVREGRCLCRWVGSTRERRAVWGEREGVADGSLSWMRGGNPEPGRAVAVSGGGGISSGDGGRLRVDDERRRNFSSECLCLPQ